MLCKVLSSYIYTCFQKDDLSKMTGSIVSYLVLQNTHFNILEHVIYANVDIKCRILLGGWFYEDVLPTKF